MPKILTLLLAFCAGTVWAQKARLGLNFPFRAPEAATIDEHMSKLTGCGAQIYRQTAYADLIWRHVEPRDNEYHFDYPDSVFKRYSQYEYVANLYSLTIANANNGNVGFQVPWRACRNSPSCGWNYALDSLATIDYLTSCVNRYQSQVKYWEIGNETQNGNYPLGIPNANFTDFMSHNYRWIKAANPEVKVLLPGTVGTYGFPMQNTYRWLHALFSSGAGKYFDVFSFHDYNSWWTTPVHIDSITAIRNLYDLQNKEIWITESSVSSSNFSDITPSYSSADEQAADVWRRSSIAWAKGISVFFWHGGWSTGIPSEWAEFGILSPNGKKKKSYHSYKLLAEKLANFEKAEVVSMGVVDDNNRSSTGGNGVWVMKFASEGQNKLVMWSRNRQAFRLKPETDMKYVITRVVPNTISDDGESVSFKIDTVNVKAGEDYVFNLTSIPILAEEEIVQPLSVSDNSEYFSIEIYPNPSQSQLQIKNRTRTDLDLSLSDMFGTAILSATVPAFSDKTLDLSNLPKGIYLCQAKSKNGFVKNTKLIIE
jgi:hypothetical protein